MSDYERIRLVVLGGASVGKSAIIRRLLGQGFSDKYRPTVEDLYSRECTLGTLTLKVDLLDTAGDQQFPAMRRLSIATAHAFLLVYSTCSLASFECVKRCFEEVREQRPDFQLGISYRIEEKKNSGEPCKITRSGSPSSAGAPGSPKQVLAAQGSSVVAVAEEVKSKPRSRSLIRRHSRKTKQQIRDAHAEDCNIS
ncbi:GTP-binding protein Rhes [Copidosoma floridanum]|uniref:GTP-binding protein Rhes n=1 Tax=Copidosoma floridanum TaxID=29053 RepID=UPI0006C9A04B|nr:GTP-binding protein Rhes [Copidosoma floridanum]